MVGREVGVAGALRAGPGTRRPGLGRAERISRAVGPVAKRAFDVLGSFIGLLLLSPWFVLIVLAIKLDSAGPVFYRGKRVGKDGKPFWMYKFRTMKNGPADTGPRVTARDDPRVTRFGHILRDTKLNELPQFINVLKGEMSFVGPRPEDPSYVALYTPEQHRVLSVTPGVTSIASILYRDEEMLLSQDALEDTYVNVIMPDKLRLDLEYVAHRSFLVDLDILFHTVLVLLPRFARVAPDIEELFFGPVQCFVRRRLSWFTLDLILGLEAVSMASFLWWHASRSPRVSWPLNVAFIVGIALTFTFMNQMWGLQRSMWSCASVQEACDILLSTICSTVLLVLINAWLLPRFSFSHEVILLGGCFACVAFTVARYRSRLVTGILWRWRNLWGKNRRNGQKRLLIVGTGEVGQFFAWQVQNRREGQRYHIVGFVDDDLTRRGMRIHGVEVLGTRRAIPTLVAQYGVDVVVVANNLAQGECQTIADACHHTSAQVKVIPDVLQLIHETDSCS